VSAVDSLNAWACGAGGKVVGTTNGGATWTIISNATIPATVTLYYVGEAYVGVGGVLGSDGSNTYVYITSDGGTNWFNVLTQSGGFFNGAGVLDPSSPTFMIMGDPVGGRWSLFKSTDLFTWDSTGLYLPQSGSEAGWNNSIYSFRNILGLWFGTNAGYIYHSSNGGTSWNIQPTPGMTNIYAIYFNGALNLGMAGGDGLCSSTNSGNTWTQLTSPSPSGIFGIGGNFGSNTFWVAGPTSIYKTTDFGSNWTTDYTSPGGNFTNFNTSYTGDGIGYAVRDNGGITMLQFTVPVELTSFTAVSSAEKVTLSWSTATETNNHGFEIERRINSYDLNENWITIGFVDGHGTTSEPNSYNFIDDLGSTNITSVSYRLKQVDFDGTIEYSDVVDITNIVPAEFRLSQNYPNPFNPSTKISYAIPVNAHVTLKVYDALGNEITTLVNEEKPAGTYKINFDASNLSSGVYFYTLTSGNFVEAKKMILMK